MMPLPKYSNKAAGCCPGGYSIVCSDSRVIVMHISLLKWYLNHALFNQAKKKKNLFKKTASKMRGRNGWSWFFSMGGRQQSAALMHCHASRPRKQLNGELSLFDLSTVVNGNTAPALGDPLASCQVVFVYTALICAHVWCISGTFSVILWMFLKSCEASAFICWLIFYTAAQLHFIVEFMKSNTYITQTGHRLEKIHYEKM